MDPTWPTALFGVLLRFRQYKVALAADIEAMFYQVNVTPDDRDAFRFMWWPGRDLTLPPKHYRMTCHVFGAVSSPFIANHAIKQAAEDAGKTNSKAAKTAKTVFSLTRMTLFWRY